METTNHRAELIAEVFVGGRKKRLKVSAQRLETERVILLPWDSGDWLAFKPIATDPRVMRYISAGVPWSDSRIIEFVERQQRNFAGIAYCLWKLVQQGETKIAGFCGLQPLQDLPGIEIGWWFASHLWGQRLAAETAHTVMTDGFGRCGLNRIVAIALRENKASTRTMEKLGMSYEKDSVHHGFEVVLYAIEK